MINLEALKNAKATHIKIRINKYGVSFLRAKQDDGYVYYGIIYDPDEDTHINIIRHSRIGAWFEFIKAKRRMKHAMR